MCLTVVSVEAKRTHQPQTYKAVGASSFTATDYELRRGRKLRLCPQGECWLFLCRILFESCRHPPTPFLPPHIRLDQL